MISLLIYALAPVFFIILFIYIKDKYEKEPKHLLVLSFLLGAIISIIITTLIYALFDEVLPLDSNTAFQLFIKAFIIVGLTEEFSKYVIVRYFSQSRRAFNEPFDGIIYAVMVSMGFAATENIFYVFNYGAETALIRAFTAIPAHATFGVLMGYFMGKAKFSSRRKLLNFTGLFLAILFHGSYDFFLFLDYIPGIWIGAMVSLLLGVFLSLKAIKRHQNNSHFKY